jgi:serine/threonine protein kinase
MALHTLQPDTMLREYRIIKLLGEGGFGLTYLAFDTHLEKHVAIKEYMPAEHAVRESDSKIVPRSSASEKTYKWGLNAFLNEAKTLAKFENPSIVRIYRFFKENGTAYIVMEYCQGGCLIDIISKDKPMDEQKLKQIITSIVNGLQLVHKEGILHRDIKPDNIMFRANGSAVLIDFGAARQAIGDKSRKVTTIITPGYAPLEQYSTKGKIGPWSDIYSLAAVAYLCITGKKPPDIMNRLHDDTIAKLSDRLNSSAFLQAIDRGLMLQVGDRPKNLSDWSSLWNDSNSTNDTVQSKPIQSEEAIFAKKEISADTHYFKPQVISAQPNISTRDQTTLNTNKFNQNNRTSGFRFFKWLLVLMTLLVLTVVAYVAYEHFINKKQLNELVTVKALKTKWNSFFTPTPEKSPKINTPIKNNYILNAQKKLNLLGYKVAQSGELDIRTQQSIKKFEQDNQLVITGVVDDILINELSNKIESLEQENWTQTLLTNTTAAYQNFDTKYPNSPHQEEIEENIRRLKELKSIQLKQQNEQLQQEAINQNQKKQKQRLISVAQEKKKLIKDIQAQFIRLKYKDLSQTGNLDLQTKSLIETYQKLRNLPINGLPTKTLLFKLKTESRWPGRHIGETFKTCNNCPQMVVIKAGSFIMGNETGPSTQKPAHNVYIKEFSISQLPVSFKQWDSCYADGFCTYQPSDEGNGRKQNPVTNISYRDSIQFINWLKSLSGKNYQLPSEAQWEFAASSTIRENPYQLKNPTNSITELIADCWHPNYLDAPTNGSARKDSVCQDIVTRTNLSKKNKLSLYNRAKLGKTERKNTVGFRVTIIHD